MTLASALGPSAYWYLTRGTGAVALLLLTVSVVLGLVGTVRYTAPRWPRFAIDTVHRDVSLLVIVLLVLHVVTTVLDGFAPISLLDGLIPFASAYRPLWLGLGTLAFDLILAIAITSLVRRRLGYRTWRAVHWLAYVSWPIAVLHTLGTGTDVKQWWLLLLTVICAVAVLAAVLVRIGTVDRTRGALRGGAFTLAAVAPLGIAIFALVGPLQHGWAAKAGTPASLLPHTTRVPAPTAASVSTKAATGPPAGTHELTQPFESRLSGRLVESRVQNGEIAELRLKMSGQVKGSLRLRLGGQPLPSGGLTMTGSQVDMAADGTPSVYQGQVQQLAGDHIEAHVVDSAGKAFDLSATVNIDTQTGSITGTLLARPA